MGSAPEPGEAGQGRPSGLLIVLLAAGLTVLVAALIGAVLYFRNAGPPPAVRVVLVSLDTLREDAFREHMPLLSERARRAGRVFAGYHSATPSTQPTHAVLFTGLDPWRTGVPKNGVRLPGEHFTLAEELARKGFQTGAVVSSMPLHRRFGFSQGFDRYRDEFGEAGPGGEEGLYSKAAEVTELALQMLDRQRSPRQFFFFHYFDPHEPYGDHVTSEYVRPANIAAQIAEDPGLRDGLLEEARALYAADVRVLDRELDRLLTRLEADSERVETHVLVVSDHGESFGEGELLGHGEIAPEQIEVPCVLLSPRVAPGESTDLVGTTDLHATLLALAGVAGPSAGRDLTDPDLAPRPVYGMRQTYARPYEEPTASGATRTLFGPRFFLATDTATWVGNGESLEIQRGPAEPGGEPGPGEPDPGEPNPGAPDRSADVRAVFARFTLDLAEHATGAVEDPETRAAMRALGYAD